MYNTCQYKIRPKHICIISKKYIYIYRELLLLSNKYSFILEVLVKLVINSPIKVKPAGIKYIDPFSRIIADRRKEGEFCYTVT